MSKILNEKLNGLSVWDLNGLKNAIDNKFQRLTVDGKITLDYYTKWDNLYRECLSCCIEDNESLKKEYSSNKSITYGEIIYLSINRILNERI